MNRSTDADKPRPVGRPKSLPDGTKNRNYRLTDEEHTKVRAYIARLKKLRRKPASGTNSPSP